MESEEARDIGDEPLREEDVTRADKLDDRVEEGDGLDDDGDEDDD